MAKHGPLLLRSLGHMFMRINVSVINANLIKRVGGAVARLRIQRPGFEPCRGHCVVFLGKTLYSHSASLHPGV